MGFVINKIPNENLYYLFHLSYLLVEFDVL